MRIGCCISMLSSREDPLGLRNLPLLAEAGYDYLEIPLAGMSLLTDDAFFDLLNTLEDHGIPCEACNDFFPAGLRLTGPEVCWNSVRRYLEKAAFRAAQAGVSVIVFGSAPAKNIPDGFDRDAALVQYGKALMLAADICDRVGIQIVIEPICHRESNLLRYVSEGYAIQQALSQSGLFLLADFYHMHVGREPLSHLHEAAGAIRHLHISSRDRRFPNELESLQYSAFFHAARSMGYDARVSVEGYSDQLGRDAASARAILLECIKEESRLTDLPELL